MIAALNTYGVTQGKLAEMTGIPQGRLSEYKTGRHTATAVSTFVAFADGIGMSLPAREALGLAANEPPDGASAGQPGDASAADAGLMYPDTTSDAAGNLSSLWQSDLVGGSPDERKPGASRRTVLLAATGIAAGAWSGAALRWLTSDSPGLLDGGTSGTRIGMAEVAQAVPEFSSEF